ncbi:RusA family crossover junction endodeoxyribonuclease [Marivirga harenae]|uniref:RusA family crossover junction endodeoxyribonuclease n=1 Tax=Marivirga harenae TaxID=2010992 RepID=UPI0026DFCC76|nr:RusA family crossover junction endodeoxyribonuclease [Marivirga harenae]WKV11806.1 RusA family crossover junction endodeoxyribonuclease [Marivirga harenae]
MTNENFEHSLDSPPEFGELTLSFPIEPVSLQSNSSKREFVKTSIRKSVKKLNYLLSGDVKIEIQWLVHEQERYESPNSPDMDNIIKPILDGLSGPDGVLIDDCQVQTVGSHWIDWTKREHQINISIRYIPDDYITKQNLIFVNMGSNLYMPFHTDLPPEFNLKILNHLKKGFDLKERFMEQTLDYYQAKLFTSVQRVFHKSRVHGHFKTVEFDDFKNQLEK